MTAANETSRPSPADDRRRFSRIRFPKVRVQAPGPEGWQDEFLQDLSVGGVFLVSQRTLPVGSEIQLRLLVPDSDEPIHLPATVTRIEQGMRDADSGIALSFFDLTEAETARLRDLVERFGSEPTVTLFDDETGEPHDTPAMALSRDVDELGRQWAAAKKTMLEARSTLQRSEEALAQSQGAFEEAMRHVRLSAQQLPTADAAAAAPAPASDGGESTEASHRETNAEVEQVRETLTAVREDLASERERSRELAREVEDLKESLRTIESPESDRDQRIQMLTAELLQMKEQAHRHEAEAAEARLALAELRSQTELTSGEHLPPLSPAALRQQQAEEGFEVDFERVAEEAEEDLEELEPLDDVASDAASAPEAPPESDAEEASSDEGGGDSGGETSFADVAEETLPMPLPEVQDDVDAPEDAPKSDAEAETDAGSEAGEGGGGAQLVGAGEDTDGPDTIDSIEAFQARLTGGSRIRITERFGRLEPVSRGDIQVSDWLREHDVFSADSAAAADMGEEQLVRVLHVFFQRELIRLVP